MPSPVISVEQMRAWEQATWDSGQAVDVVMRLAGRAVANAARRLARPDAPVLVLAGKGNNGGDAKYAAEELEELDVILIDCADESTTLANIREELGRAAVTDGLVIDGLFGIGLNRAPEGRWAEIIEAVNHSGARVLAVDAPSGLDCDRGDAPGAVVTADTTLTFGAPKTGLLSAGATRWVGRLEVAPDIGLVACPAKSEVEWLLDSDFTNFPPRRPIGGHKGAFGHLAILAGSTGYHGAAVLAALGAQRAMPGLISVYPTERAYQPVASQLRQCMVHPWTPQTEFPKNATAILIGPGLAGPDVDPVTIEKVRELWRTSRLPIVVDASALDWLQPGGETPGIRIVTPHPGEASRMLGIANAEVQADRVAAARAVSAKYGACRVVLKGCRTVIAGGAVTAVNGTGNAGLGQGGSGDILAGYLAGLVAQPLLRERLDDVVRFAVHQHGLTADCLSESAQAWDLDDFIPLLGNACLG